MIKDITILIGGAAGQGIQTIGSLLASVCHNAGLFIFSMDDFQSRIRGGHSFHLLRISNQPLSAPTLKPDIIVAIDKKTHDFHKEQLSPNGIVLINNSSDTGYDSNVYPIDLERLAKEAGGVISMNTVAAGCVLAALGASFDQFKPVLQVLFASKGEAVLNLNLEAGKKGIQAGQHLNFFQQFDFNPKAHHHKVMSGAMAAALGALAADCRFFPFYPMSPGTPIISSAALYADQLPIVIEQAEDEIAAVNMAIGASFAGVRSLTATSGGGFCLMTEGLGLSAMTETPIVIINAQRPGPATGLATRTAQADLLFSIHASQDEFPRFVFAPGGVLETFQAVKKAFKLSERYQVPAIVLMDQFLVDSARTQIDEFKNGDSHISVIDHEPMSDQAGLYHRYQMTPDGISPRKIPCESSALVRAAGNEHTPEGLTTEDPELRTLMVQKRFKKLNHMKQEMNMPSIFCPESSFFLVGWGSSKGSIMEACLHLREEGIDAGWIIFEDLWPLDEQQLKKQLENKKLILVEGNTTGQLGTLIRQMTGVDYHDAILKFDGRPIYPEYIIKHIKALPGLTKGQMKG
ncbi:MAG: 2-oxoacid:acceptor oxidoreductase subunit alpha [Pseudomonadota bacterium]